MKLPHGLYIFIFFSLFIILTCDLPNPHEPKPGVVITWDIEGSEALEYWYSMRDQIQELNIPFTLYIRLPEPLTDEQAGMLKALEANGHEIGLHTRFHKDAIVYILIEGHTIEEYAQLEIIPPIEDFAAHDIHIKNFAYPLAHHFTELDTYMLEHFVDSLRSVSPNIDWCYYKGDDNRVISAYWIDDLEIIQEKEFLKQVYNALRKAKRFRYVLNLYGHNIADPEKEYYTTFERLKKIINYARDLDLEFYRMEDLFSNW